MSLNVVLFILAIGQGERDLFLSLLLSKPHPPEAARAENANQARPLDRLVLARSRAARGRGPAGSYSYSG